jgi:hypothetical protein
MGMKYNNPNKELEKLKHLVTENESQIISNTKLTKNETDVLQLMPHSQGLSNIPYS